MRTCTRIILSLIVAGSLACGGNDSEEEREYPDINQLYQEGERDFQGADLPGIDLHAVAGLQGAGILGCDFNHSGMEEGNRFLQRLAQRVLRLQRFDGPDIGVLRRLQALDIQVNRH